MKKVIVMCTTCIMLTMAPLSVCASSLDSLIDSKEEATTVTVDEQQAVEQPAQQTEVQQNQPVQQEQNVQTPGGTANYSNKDLISSVQEATDLSDVSPGAQKINKGINKVASFIVQVIAYLITAGLVVRIVIDLCYIGLPFTRSFLANGYQGNSQAGAGGMPNQGMMGGGMGMGGMNGGMGMGGYGMRGGYGMNRMGGMGMGGMGMGGMQGQMGAQPAMGRIQWVSNAALNAAAAESVVGPDGKAVSPFKAYMKDMTVVLIITPVLLVLAISGALTDLGFLLGDLLANAIEGIGTML